MYLHGGMRHGDVDCVQHTSDCAVTFHSKPSSWYSFVYIIATMVVIVCLYCSYNGLFTGNQLTKNISYLLHSSFGQDDDAHGATATDGRRIQQGNILETRPCD